jgi:hypothetical protein
LTTVTGFPVTLTKITAAGLLLLALGDGNSQTVSAQSQQLCVSALSDRGARLAIPVLNSQSVRETSCGCLAAAMRQSATEQSAKAVIEANLGSCIARAAPAEKMVSLPLAVLGQLEDAYAEEAAPRVFIRPKADLTNCKMPEYPIASQRANVSGNTRLAFHIRANSSVIDGEVMGSAGTTAAHKLLDITALFSLMQCKFEPAQLRGKSLSAWIEVEYQGRLE